MKSYWFVFCKTDIVLEKTADGYTIPLSEHCPAPLKAWSQVLDIDPMPDGTDVKTVNIDMPLTDNPSFEMCGLRNSYYKLQPEHTLLRRLRSTDEAEQRNIQTLHKLRQRGVATGIASRHCLGSSWR